MQKYIIKKKSTTDIVPNKATKFTAEQERDGGVADGLKFIVNLEQRLLRIRC